MLALKVTDNKKMVKKFLRYKNASEQGVRKIKVSKSADYFCVTLHDDYSRLKNWELHYSWIVLRVSLSSLQKYIGKELTLRELIEHPNDGYLYVVDIDNSLVYHDIKLVQPSALPDDYLPENDSYYEFEPIPAEDAKELMTYELTIPYKERNHFEEILRKIGFPCCFS